MAAEDPDKNSELYPLHECEYVFGTEEKSLKDSLTEFKSRILDEERGV